MNKQSAKFIDAYKILELSNISDLTNKQIKQAYLKLIKQYHPDTLSQDDTEYESKLEEYNRLTQLINEAYQLVKDTVSRTKYSVEYEKYTHLEKLNNVNIEYQNLKYKVKPDVVSNVTYHKHDISILDMYSDKYSRKIQLTLKDGFKPIFNIKSYKQLIPKPILKKFVYKTLVDNSPIFKEQSFIIDLNVENYDDEYVSVMYHINTGDVHFILKDKSLFKGDDNTKVDNLLNTVTKYLKISKDMLWNKLDEISLLMNSKQKIIKFDKLGIGRTTGLSFIQGSLYVQLDDSIVIEEELIDLKLLGSSNNNNNPMFEESFNNEYTSNSLPIILLFILSAYLIENFIFN